MKQPLAEDLALLAAAPLVTGRYAAFRPEHGVPIRSTCGAPKRFRGGPLVFARQLAPWGLLSPTISDDEARRRYVARLDDTIVMFLAGVARAFPGQQLVVLCYENVHAGQHCHRRWFAEWFEGRYGIEVPELVDVDHPRLPL